ncbi:MAG: glycosyltransferase family 2 protein, partial [Eubacterium sp.]|nr:glycosyltransferase family 2 protein [Eubacterium sp.]
MKISIVMPVYNGERYLAGAIRSVLEQSYPNFELIIVNDASTDGSLKIAEVFAAKDDRIRVYTNEHNQKLPRSLNIGFSHCEGELYTWTSDDNLLLP